MERNYEPMWDFLFIGAVLFILHYYYSGVYIVCIQFCNNNVSLTQLKTKTHSVTVLETLPQCLCAGPQSAHALNRKQSLQNCKSNWVVPLLAQMKKNSFFCILSPLWYHNLLKSLQRAKIKKYSFLWHSLRKEIY
jgi:hypothetical protein